MSARIFHFVGEATVQSKNGRVRLTRTDSVHTGETLQTGADGQADILLLPGVVIELGSATRLAIEALHFTKNGDETIEPVQSRKATCRLEEGALTISVDWVPSPAHLFLQTPLGLLTVDSGSACDVRLEKGKLHLVCARRAVNFRPLHANEMRLAAGFFADWPGTVGAQSAAHSGFQAQAELAKVLRTQLMLQKRARATYAKLNPWQEQ